MIDSSTARAFLLTVIVLALTASCLIAVTVYGMRAGQRVGELFTSLLVVSIVVPTLLVIGATRLPPELFDFLR